MKTMKRLNIKRGEEIIFKGERLQVTKPTTLKVAASAKTDTGNTPSAPQEASHKSDEPQGVDKDTVLGIVQKEIDDLETKEHQLLISDSQHDFLFENEEQEESTIDDHIGLAFQIMNLKKILNAVKSL